MRRASRSASRLTDFHGVLRGVPKSWEVSPRRQGASGEPARFGAGTDPRADGARRAGGGSHADGGGIRSVICPSLHRAGRGARQGAGFAVATEEALRTADLHPLADWIAAQPEWSDFPFILLTLRGGIERNPAAIRLLQTLGNVNFLERPFHPTTLVSLAQSAIRGRRRQYEARARLEALAHLNETLEARVTAAIAEHKVLADIVESTDALVQVVDLDQRILAVNRASALEFERRHGVRPRVGDSLAALLASPTR